MTEETEIPKETEAPKEEAKEPKTPTPPTSIDLLNKALDRKENLLKQETELQDRREKLHTEQMLGGHSEAGQAPAEKKELTDEEYKEKILAGEKPE